MGAAWSAAGQGCAEGPEFRGIAGGTLSVIGFGRDGRFRTGSPGASISGSAELSPPRCPSVGAHSRPWGRRLVEMWRENRGSNVAKRYPRPAPGTGEAKALLPLSSGACSCHGAEREQRRQNGSALPTPRRVSLGNPPPDSCSPQAVLGPARPSREPPLRGAQHIPTTSNQAPSS